MSSKISNGQIIQPTWLVPVIPEQQVLLEHSLVIRDDKIINLLSNAAAVKQYPEFELIKLDQQLVCPGLVNTHGHMAMTLLRGYADDIALMDWLNLHIWPAEAEFADAEFVYDGTLLAIAEMISTGTTCGADSYFFPDASAKAMADCNYRGQVGVPIIQFDNAWACGEQQHLEKGLAVAAEYKDSEMINFALAPHAPYTVTDEGFASIKAAAETHGLPIHLHLHETADEVDQALAANQPRPFERIRKLGLMGPNLQTVHMTQLNDDEIQVLAETGTHVAHCPDSNMKLASGFCPIEKLSQAGVNIGIGTDGAASNNNLDMLSEIRNAALLAKVTSGKADSLSAHQALYAGTMGGAKLMGIDHLIGSLEIGKQADIISVDLSAANFQPVYHPVSQLIYTATGHQVDNVWVNGKQLYKQRRHTQLDIKQIISKAVSWQQKISKHADQTH